MTCILHHITVCLVQGADHLNTWCSPNQNSLVANHPHSKVKKRLPEPNLAWWWISHQPDTFLTRVDPLWLLAPAVPVMSARPCSSSGPLSSGAALLSTGSPFSKASRLLPSKGPNPSFFNPNSSSALREKVWVLVEKSCILKFLIR